MWKILILSICLIFWGCASLKSKTTEQRNPTSANSEVSPRLFIQPAPIFDILCQQTPFKINSELQTSFKKELDEKIDLFQSEWDKVANSLITESENAAGRKFSRKEYSVALSLCGWTPMGDPVFLVSALAYLGPTRKMNGFDLPMSMNEFVSMTHHELLHSLVDNIINNEFFASSELLLKYAKENYNVLVHLHLMAIQKAAYQKLDNKILMTATNKLYSFIGGDYQRAWTIVNTEGTEKFLNEIKSFNSKKN